MDVVRRANAGGRLEEKSIDYAEHGGIDADGESQRRDDGEAESRLAKERSGGMANVVAELVPPVGAALAVQTQPVDRCKLGPRAVNVAVLTLGRFACGRGRHPASDEIRDA